MAGVGVGDGRTSSGLGTGVKARASKSTGITRTPSQGRPRRITVPRRSRDRAGGGAGSGTASGRPRGNEPYGRSAFVGTNLRRVYGAPFALRGMGWVRRSALDLIELMFYGRIFGEHPIDRHLLPRDRREERSQPRARHAVRLEPQSLRRVCPRVFLLFRSGLPRALSRARRRGRLRSQHRDSRQFRRTILVGSPPPT